MGASGDLEAGLWTDATCGRATRSSPTRRSSRRWRKNANHSDALLVAGIALSRQGKYKEAKELLERGAKRKSDTDFEFALGMIADVTGRRQDAIYHYEAALRFDPDNHDATARLARLVPMRKSAAQSRPGSPGCASPSNQ